MLIDVRDRVREGAMLSEALEAQGVFPGVYTTAILAGEKSGNLTGVLDNYIAFQRVSQGFRNRLKTVMIYPAILVVAVVSVVVVPGDLRRAAICVAVFGSQRKIAGYHPHRAGNRAAHPSLYCADHSRLSGNHIPAHRLGSAPTGELISSIA